MLACSFLGTERTKYFPVLMLVIKWRPYMWCVVYLFLCLLFLPFPLTQSSAARDKDEQALPVGSGGPAVPVLVPVGSGGGRAGRGRGSGAQQTVPPLEYLRGVICRCACTLWFVMTAHWTPAATDTLSLGFHFKCLRSLFHLAWTFIGDERVRYSQIAFQGMLSWYLGTTGESN